MKEIFQITVLFDSFQVKYNMTEEMPYSINPLLYCKIMH